MNSYKAKSLAVASAVGKSEALSGNRTKPAVATVTVVSSAMMDNSLLKMSGNKMEFMMGMAVAGNSMLAASDSRMDNNSATGHVAIGELSTAVSSDINGGKMKSVIATASPLASPSSLMLPSLLADIAVNKTHDGTHLLTFQEDL